MPVSPPRAMVRALVPSIAISKNGSAPASPGISCAPTTRSYGAPTCRAWRRVGRRSALPNPRTPARRRPNNAAARRCKPIRWWHIRPKAVSPRSIVRSPSEYQACCMDRPSQRIDARRGELVTQQGRRFAWKQLVSTLPLPALIGMIEEVPQAIAVDTARLVALPVNLVLLALTGRLENPMQRLYSPDPAITGHKFVFNHNSSTYLRALPRHGIQVEISGNRPEDDAALTELAAGSARKLGAAAGGNRYHSEPGRPPALRLSGTDVGARVDRRTGVGLARNPGLYSRSAVSASGTTSTPTRRFTAASNLGCRLAGIAPVLEHGHTEA